MEGCVREGLCEWWPRRKFVVVIKTSGAVRYQLSQELKRATKTGNGRPSLCTTCGRGQQSILSLSFGRSGAAVEVNSSVEVR